MPVDPHARLTGTSAVLLVRDVVAGADHYRDALGFEAVAFFGEPPGFAILGRDGMRLMLKKADNPEDIVPLWKVADKTCSAYFWVDNADSLHKEFVERGAAIDYGPCDQPYGCREFGVQDLDGHDIAFGQIVE